MIKSNQWAVWMTSATWIVMGAAAVAQNPAPCITPVALGALSYGPQPKVGAPYSATLTTTRDQKLADGSVVHGSVTTYQARDSAGREWFKRSFGCQSGPDGMRRPDIQTLVYDPGTGTTTSWEEDDPAKILHVVHDPAGNPLAPAETGPAADAAGRRALEEMGIHTEDLGSKKIAGVMAEGTRAVQTVLARQPGIAQPIKIVREQWISKELDLEMLRVSDSSKNGRTASEVVNLTQGEPDAALFTPPAGYTIAASPAR
jgi:hypothetical protein